MVYEKDDKAFPGPAYRIRGEAGVAFWALGWETVADEDTEWSGIRVRTGKVVCMMVGDDRHFAFDPDDLTPLKEEDYCGGCGQIGCKCGQ